MSKRKLRLSLYSERRLGPLSGRIFWVAGTLGVETPTPQGLRRGQIIRLCWPPDEGAP
jgi:hypothetical protein